MTERSDSIMPIEERLDVQDERLNKQDDRLNKQDERLNQHSDKITMLLKYDEEKHERLKLMEEQDKKNEERLQEVEKNYTRLESTIVSENREMRSFFLTNMDKQWDLIKSRDEQRHDNLRMKHELSKTTVERWSDIFFKLVGSGSVLYVLIQTFIK
ncbi:hypothetical protein [Sporosarcina koreensis]|uniref:hypothetical protein n=1 Tax=Sporosarcina koreensis TaxID=334735 RepID=UPI000756C8DD|nr:hypothetical protein [Sporosarcina koreensis]